MLGLGPAELQPDEPVAFCARCEYDETVADVQYYEKWEEWYCTSCADARESDEYESDYEGDESPQLEGAAMNTEEAGTVIEQAGEEEVVEIEETEGEIAARKEAEAEARRERALKERREKIKKEADQYAELCGVASNIVEACAAVDYAVNIHLNGPYRFWVFIHDAKLAPKGIVHIIRRAAGVLKVDKDYSQRPNVHYNARLECGADFTISVFGQCKVVRYIEEVIPGKPAENIPAHTIPAEPETIKQTPVYDCKGSETERDLESEPEEVAS